MSASRASGEAYIGTRSPASTPLQRRGQGLGVEREVGDDVAAGPPRQQRRPAVVLVGQGVDGAHQALVGVVQRGSQGLGHGSILAHGRSHQSHQQASDPKVVGGAT